MLCCQDDPPRTARFRALTEGVFTCKKTLILDGGDFALSHTNPRRSLETNGIHQKYKDLQKDARGESQPAIDARGELMHIAKRRLKHENTY